MQIPTALDLACARGDRCYGCADTVQMVDVVDVKMTARPGRGAHRQKRYPGFLLGKAPKGDGLVPPGDVEALVDGGGAAKLPLPGWLAWMVQVPASNTVTVRPDTEQTPEFEARLTASPEDAVAVTVNGADPNALFVMAPKVMVWFAADMVKLWSTGAAWP